MAKTKGIDALLLPPLRDLPPVGKYIALAGEAYVLYKGYGLAKKLLFPAPGAETVNQATTEAQSILKANKNLPPGSQTLPSFSPSQMSTFADTLYTAMDGAGTDMDAITSVFKQMKNDLDILLLIDAFGVREGSGWFSGGPENLAQWLQGDGATATVNNILKTKANITKRF